MQRAPTYPFRHNDPGHLSRRIGRHDHDIVVVDSVYSTTGAVCPLTRSAKVAKRHGCTLWVDESHLLGTHGPEGAGLCAERGLMDWVHFITDRLANAFSGRSGFFNVPA